MGGDCRSLQDIQEGIGAGGAAGNIGGNNPVGSVVIGWLNIGQSQCEGGLSIDVAVGSVGFLFLPLECRGTGNGGIEFHVLSGQGIYRSWRANNHRRLRHFQSVQLTHLSCTQGPVVNADIINLAFKIFILRGMRGGSPDCDHCVSCIQ